MTPVKCDEIHQSNRWKSVKVVTSESSSLCSPDPCWLQDTLSRLADKRKWQRQDFTSSWCTEWKLELKLCFVRPIISIIGSVATVVLIKHGCITGSLRNVSDTRKCHKNRQHQLCTCDFQKQRKMAKYEDRWKKLAHDDKFADFISLFQTFLPLVRRNEPLVTGWHPTVTNSYLWQKTIQIWIRNVLEPMLHDTSNTSLHFANDALLSAVFAVCGCPYRR